MLTGVVLTGLACGILLAAVGFVLWNGFRQVPGLSQAVRVLSWLAGALLLLSTLSAWLGDHSLYPLAPPLILMAALAAPPNLQRRRNAHWSNVLPILPALALAGIGLFWTTKPGEPGTGSLPAMAELVVVICGGLGARALGRTLSEVVASTLHVEWPIAAVYALLTLLVGSTALVNLWQRGAVWGGSASESGLAAAWLAWSAAWVSPHLSRRLRPVLTAVAALFLIVLAAGYAMLDGR